MISWSHWKVTIHGLKISHGKHLGVIHLIEYLWQSSWELPSLNLFCKTNKILLTTQYYLILRFIMHSMRFWYATFKKAYPRIASKNISARNILLASNVIPK